MRKYLLPQEKSKITYAYKIKKSETRINWKDKAKDIVAKINALYPTPGSWFKFNGNRIKILKAKEIEATGNPGEIINDKFLSCVRGKCNSGFRTKKRG